MSSAVITPLESSSAMPVQQLRDENNSILSLEQIKSPNDSIVLEMPSSMIYPGLNEALTNSGIGTENADIGSGGYLGIVADTCGFDVEDFDMDGDNISYNSGLEAPESLISDIKPRSSVPSDLEDALIELHNLHTHCRAQQRINKSQQKRLCKLDKFVRAISSKEVYDIHKARKMVQYKVALHHAQKDLRRSRTQLMLQEDEIAENRKFHSDSLHRNKRQVYVMKELGLRLYESRMEAEVEHREQHLKQLKTIEDLERRLSASENKKYLSNIEELKVQLGREKLLRGNVARILLNEHHPAVAVVESLRLLTPSSEIFSKSTAEGLSIKAEQQPNLFHTAVAKQLLELEDKASRG
ncbi:hypothetical protein EV359DRAFT_78227 [Lentinula novae-zelandiae]|nr:hypothetical protein EV359DRAFT_78227 [Lentinula novae-zelandiae]